MAKRSIKKNIWHCAIFLFVCFSALALYIMYLQVVEADVLASRPTNPRMSAAESEIQRGSIVDASNQKLAYTDGSKRRVYPLKAAAAPVTGYIGENIGSAGMEGFANRQLLGLTENMSRLGPVAQLLVADRGNDVKLTLRADVQKTAYEALGSRRGAAVVLDAQTGAVLAMVSTPAYDPNHIDENWKRLNQQDDSPLLNRASQGLYPPGSTLKVMMADIALKEQVTNTREIFHCAGQLDLGGGYVLHESHGAVHGDVDIGQALTESCNITFGTLAMRLGASRLDKAFEQYGFRKDIGNEFAGSMPRLPEFAKLGQGDIAQIGIGQSELLVTPLRMAMLASAFANHGVIMTPYLIDEIISPGGVIIEKSQQKKWLEVTSAGQAALIDGFMEQVVQNGTGTAARISGVRVTGKTGTAENAGGADHAWFIGTADVGGRKISFAIIVENSGGGGTEAAPIARKIIMNLLDKG